MRQHNKYLDKVFEEMDVYRQHLLGDRELSTQQAATFEKIDIVRGWLRQGFSDIDVIKLAKTDPRLNVQDRRAREILAMSYEVFAELRSLRNRDGIKLLYAEQFKAAAQLVMEKIIGIADGSDQEESEDYDDEDEGLPDFAKRKPKVGAKEMALLMKEYRALMKEAGTIDGAYDTSKVGSGAKNRPTKIVLKRRTVITNGETKSDDLTEEVSYESVD